MNNHFYAYLNFHFIGVEYFNSLPAPLRTAINDYNVGQYYRLGGVNYCVTTQAPPPPFPAAPMPLPAAPNIGGHGGGWAAPAAPPPALGAVLFGHLGVAETTVHNTLGGAGIPVHTATRNSASPFVFNSVLPALAVNYANGISVTNFLLAWRALVAHANGGAAFVWPNVFGAANARLEFVAAVFAESFRDKVQLGAIRLLMDSGWRAFANQPFVQVLPMCAGGTYWPHLIQKVNGGNDIVTASPTTWQRCWRLFHKNVVFPHGVNQILQQQLIQGHPLNGKIPTWSYTKCQKYFPNHVKNWW